MFAQASNGSEDVGMHQHTAVRPTHTIAARRVAQVVLAIGLLAALAITTAVNGAAPASATTGGASDKIAIKAPSGLTPSTGTVNANPVFAWSAVAGASGYDVELASDGGFNHVISLQSQVNRQFTPTDQLPMEKIYWRVRATDNGVASRWSTIASFTRAKLAGPVLLAPGNGSTLVPPTQPPLLRWAAVDGAIRYHVYVDDAPDFLGAKEYDVQTTSLLNPEAQDAATYYWKVVAEISDGLLTNPSATRSYVVGSLGPITGASPDVDASGNIPDVEQVVLSWNPLPGAVTYDIRVSTDINFPDNTIVEQRNLTGTRYSPPQTYNVDEYYWQVRPRNTFGFAKDWSQVPVHRFSRTYFDTDNAATGTATVPTLLYPANTLSPPTTGDFYYQWTPTRLASVYEIQVSADAAFSVNVDDCVTTQTTLVPSVQGQCGFSPGIGTRYYWRVRGIDQPAGVNSRWSEIHQFVYSEPMVNQVSPADGTTVTVPTLTWDLSTDAVRYRVSVIDKNNDTVGTDTYSNSWTPNNLLKPADGPFHWSVQGIDSLGRATPLPVVISRSFSLADPSTAGGVSPTPTGPAPTAAATDRFPQLTWTPVAGASTYKVYVGPAGGTFFAPIDGAFAYPAATDITDQNLAPGAYSWFVVALNAQNQVVATGSQSTFSIAALDPVVNQRVALDGSGLVSGATPCTRSLVTDPANVCSNMTSTPTLDWDPVVGAGYYIVYLSRDKHFQNTLGTFVTAQSRWSIVSTLPDSQAGVAYYWFVRPCKAPGVCAPDPTEAFNAFDKLSPKVQGPVVQADDGNDITFSWRDYLTTNQATSDPITGEHPGQAGRTYRIQVATTQAFNTILDDQLVDQRTYTAFDRLYPEGPLYWRVQAIDGSGYGLPWSDVQTFTKSSPKPSVIAPQVSSSPATSTLTETGPFSWTATPFASRYEVQVYKNNDTTASPANLVTEPNSVGQTAATVDKPLATGVVYAWRVRRYDASNNPGGWSDWGRFRVTGKAPVQSAPASNALVSSTSSLFRWGKVPGAAIYRYERRQSGTSNDTDVIDTASTAWAFQNPLQTGRWEWRVSSMDANGQIIASSVWRKFRVDATVPTILKVSPQSPFARSANIDIRFSETIRGASMRTIKLFVSGTHRPIPMKVTTRGSLVILNPKAFLRKATTYDVVLTAGVKDTAGLSLQPTTFQVGTK